MKRQRNYFKIQQIRTEFAGKSLANKKGVVNLFLQLLDFQCGGSGIRTQDPLRARQVL